MKLRELKKGDYFRFDNGNYEKSCIFAVTEYGFGSPDSLSEIYRGIGSAPYLDREVEKVTLKVKDLKLGQIFRFVNKGFDQHPYKVISETHACSTKRPDTWKWCLSTYLEKEVVLVAPMNIIEALQAIKNGKKMRSIDWEKYQYVQLKNTKITWQDGTIGFNDLDDLEEGKWEEYIERLEVEVKLNDEHTAIVSPDGVKVGCQSFSLDVVEELHQAMKKVKKCE